MLFALFRIPVWSLFGSYLRKTNNIQQPTSSNFWPNFVARNPLKLIKRPRASRCARGMRGLRNLTIFSRRHLSRRNVTSARRSFLLS